MAEPLSTLFGEGEPACRSIGEDVSVHYWPSAVQPGDRCLCGARRYVDAFGAAPDEALGDCEDGK